MTAVRGILAQPTYVLVAVVVLALVNFTLIRMVLTESPPTDWRNYMLGIERLAAGLTPYEIRDGLAGFNYNPLVLLGFSVLLPAVGLAGWGLLHVASAALLPRPLNALALVAFPFWWDLVQGNVMVFLVFLAAWALRGQGWAIAGTFVAAMLVPRPLMIPLVLWLLWKHPEWRLRFVGIAAVVGTATLATGMGLEWLSVFWRASQDMGHYWNLSPSRVIGYLWLPVGAILALLFLRRGAVGLACLAVSPYLLPGYLLMAVVDLRQDQAVRHLRWSVDVAGRPGGLRGGEVQYPLG